MQKKMIEGVRCTISNCQYWMKPNRCQAGQILMTHQSPMLVADKHGVDADKLEQTPAQRIGQTCCYTFETQQ